MLEHALHAPETAAGDDGGLDAVGRLSVRARGGDDQGVFRRERGRGDEDSDRQRTDSGSAERKAAELATGHGASSSGRIERQFRAAVARRNWRRPARRPKIRGGAGIVTAGWTRVRE